MLAGILFQLVTMTIFSILAADFIVRVISRRPYAHRVRRTEKLQTASPAADPEKFSDPTGIAPGPIPNRVAEPITAPHTLRRVELLLAGVAFASLMIYVRGVYRSIELAQGWTGYLITHEVGRALLSSESG